MFKTNEIRGLAVIIIRKGSKILVVPGFDSKKNEIFYRLPGGGIEFGEISLEAIKREIKEEFDADIININLIDVIENIFIFESRKGHEICFIYEGDFVNKDLYQKDKFDILDSETDMSAIWKDINDMEKIYPHGVSNFLISTK